MEAILKFLNEFFKAEVEAQQAHIRADTDDFNNKLKIMDSFLVDDLKQSFLIQYRTTTRESAYYEKFKSMIYKTPRHIYKITHYLHPKYNDVYLCYVSDFLGDDPEFKWLSDCLFVSKVDGELKIVKKFWWGENSLRTNKVWKEHKGYEDLTMKNAGKLIEIKRFISPDANQEKDVKQYLKNA